MFVHKEFAFSVVGTDLSRPCRVSIADKDVINRSLQILCSLKIMWSSYNHYINRALCDISRECHPWQRFSCTCVWGRSLIHRGPCLSRGIAYDGRHDSFDIHWTSHVCAGPDIEYLPIIGCVGVVVNFGKRKVIMCTVGDIPCLRVCQFPGASSPKSKYVIAEVLL